MKKIMLSIAAVTLLVFTQRTQAQDIVDVAASVDDFSTLVSAVKAADLVSTLKSDGPFTVFAPVNSGFAKIDANALNSLMEPANKEKLSAILTYHVVAGKLAAADVAAALEAGNGKAELTTVNGATLTAVSKDGGIFLMDANGNYSKIAKTDVEATNGVIHVIEDVVMPK
ncbi:fasciclin domain-containing protein [Flavobacteriaceae bacterium TP-CH-4]|uniref:Fasciclin domain-containing protein n=1 Tax=Pelagihabitans pacificus TaxID=2696054 RepID=A0A967AW94_9FLAO|nr:fasciclin domain-containing protein [Pelagihabitans pacificus]NHF61343.1 fasciclin domain-containing protein [Pelagihabitans pacificus]